MLSASPRSVVEVPSSRVVLSCIPPQIEGVDTFDSVLGTDVGDLHGLTRPWVDELLVRDHGVTMRASLSDQPQISAVHELAERRGLEISSGRPFAEMPDLLQDIAGQWFYEGRRELAEPFVELVTWGNLVRDLLDGHDQAAAVGIDEPVPELGYQIEPVVATS